MQKKYSLRELEKMILRPIKTERDYNRAMSLIDVLINAKPGTREETLLDVLSSLVELYESHHYPILPPHPIEAIKFRMEQMGMSVTDLGKLIGQKSKASEILRGKRGLSTRVMRILHDKLHIPADSLLGA